MRNAGKAIIHTFGTGTTSEVSQITGETYRKKSNSSDYTVPFGTDGTKTYYTVAQAIDTSVKANGASRTVSFTPERIRGL